MSRLEDFKNRMNNLKLYKNTTGKGYWDWKALLFAEGGEVKDNNSLITDIITNTVKYAIDNGHIDTVKAMLSNKGGIKQTSKLFYRPESGAIKPILDLYDTPIIGDALSLTDAIRNAIKGEWYDASLSFLDAASPGAVFTKGTRLNWKDWGAKKKYIPEYEAIEKEAKKNGTWLKNEDGTDFTGDAREWVVKRSKKFKESFGDNYREGYTGMRNPYDPNYITDTYLGSKDRAYTYTQSNKQVKKKGDTGIAKLVVPETDTYTVDALGNDWLHLTDKTINPYNFTNTNLIVSNVTTPTISFKNIKDDGPFGMRDVAEDLFVVRYNVPKKSILYNNGDFDLSNPDIFKSTITPYIGYKLYNKANREDSYAEGGVVDNIDDRTDHPIQLRLNIDNVLSITDFTDRINHIDNNTGQYNPFYKASEDTYGTVLLPEVTITAPWTQKGRNNAAARRGMHYVLQGLEDAAKVADPIVAGAVLPAMASIGLLGKAADLASVYLDPTNPFNYIGRFNPLNYTNINTVQRLFRNAEFNNFLATVNGNNYYRLNRFNIKKPNGNKYFVSHTTPWDEFIPYDDISRVKGSNILYEFPNKTFSKKYPFASDYKGNYTKDLVMDLGLKHLLYGNKSSGLRDKVRILSDKDAEILEMPTHTMGIKDRPLISTIKGDRYDKNPIYESIYSGNQTVIEDYDIIDALLNSTYNIYTNTDNGIQKTIFIPR